MTQTLLIAYDNLTAEHEGFFDYIYDEFSTVEELIEGVGAYQVPCATSWEIVIFSPELFPKFKEDFAKIYDVFPLIKEFKDIKKITYGSKFNALHNCSILNPTDKDMKLFERYMERDTEEWKKYQKEKSLRNRES